MTACATLCRGQFTQTDPMPYGPGTAFESSYVYGRNSPLVFTDPSGRRAGYPSQNPIRDSTYELPNVRWTDFKITGTCASASGGFIVGIGGALCDISSAGQSATTSTVGFGFAWEFGIGGGKFLSNARELDDISGWANCNSLGAGPASVEVCILPHGRISVFGEVGLTRNIWEGMLKNPKGFGGHVFLAYTSLQKIDFLAPSWCDMHRSDPSCSPKRVLI
jgi:hypothetical protein